MALVNGGFLHYTDQSLIAELSFITLTIRLILSNREKHAFFLFKLFHVLHSEVVNENMFLNTLEVHSN